VAIIFLPQRFIALNIPAGRGRYEAAHAHAAKVATAIAATVRPMTDREFCAFMWQIERELLKHAPMTSGCKHGTRTCKRNVVPHPQIQQQRYRRSQCAACPQSPQIQEKAQDYSGFGLKP
jgi:hypothetical protein